MTQQVTVQAKLKQLISQIIQELHPSLIAGILTEFLIIFIENKFSLENS